MHKFDTTNAHRHTVRAITKNVHARITHIYACIYVYYTHFMSMLCLNTKVKNSFKQDLMGYVKL